MSTDQKIIRNKVGLLNLAQMLGSVSQACKVMGYSRDSFYRSRRCTTQEESWRCRNSRLRLIRAEESREWAPSSLPVCFFHIGRKDRRCLRKLMRPDAAQPPPYCSPPVAPRTLPEADSPALNAGVFGCRPFPGMRRSERAPRSGPGIRCDRLPRT